MALIKCEECGNQISDKAQACPACGAPVNGGLVSPSGGAIQSPVVEGQKTSAEKTAQDQKKVQMGCLGCLGVVLFFVLISSLMPGKGSDPAGPSASSPSDRSSMAVVQCQNYVRDRLRSPSTADFPWLDHSVTPEGSETYLVRSYVDAQNGFGATVRNNYTCKIQYSGGDEADQRSWSLLDLSMDTP
jgi:hypothetical protein